MANISSSKKEAIEAMETIIKVLKKEFPDEASTIIRDTLKIQVNIEG